MHYYQFNIGDYSKDAKHLTLEEDAIYRRLIDLYYLSEQPIPLEINVVSKKILARGNEDLIKEVLKEFFKKTEKGFEHSRIKKDIKIYKNNKKNKVKAAKARWAKVPADADAMHMHSKRNANHKPLTINHKPLTKDQKKELISFDEFYIPYPKKTTKAESKKYWELMTNEDQQAAISGIENHTIGKSKRFIKDPIRYLKHKRWEDEAIAHEEGQQYNQSTKNKKLEESNQQLYERAQKLEREADGGGISETLGATSDTLPTTIIQ